MSDHPETKRRPDRESARHRPRPVRAAQKGRGGEDHRRPERETLHRVKPGVEVVVTPASREIYAAMKSAGMIEAFRGYGARIEMPGCGACCGTCGTIPSDGQRIISSANRNFRGRMGNAAAEIFLASPASCAEAAVRGGFGGGPGTIENGESG